MNSPRQTATGYLMATACAGLFTYGVLVSFLGATLPELRARLDFDIERGGTLFSILYLPQIVMVIVAGPLIDRFGKRPVLAVGALVCAATMVGVAYAPAYALLAVLVFVLGLAGSFLNTGSNTLVPDLYPEGSSSALNLGNIFFGLGAVFFPLLIALLAVHLGVRPTLWLIALLMAGLGLAVLVENFPAPRAASGFDWKEARRAAFDPAVINLSWVLFFYSALEISTGGWLRTYLEQEFRVSAPTSRWLLTLFWTALMLGRLAASRIVKKVRGPGLVLQASVGAVVGLVLIALATDKWVATAGIVVCGLSYAPVFPTTAGTASTYFPKHFGTVFGIMMATGLIGGLVLPAVVGYVAKASTVRAGFWLLAGTAALLLITQAIFIGYERRRFLRSDAR
jgi:FHS family glucose/mannose:H+ symporter-like MFS transporter